MIIACQKARADAMRDAVMNRSTSQAKQAWLDTRVRFDESAGRFSSSWLWHGYSSQTHEGSAVASRVMNHMHADEVATYFTAKTSFDVYNQPLY